MGRQGERDVARLPKLRRQPPRPQPGGERRQHSELAVGAGPGTAAAAIPRAAEGSRAEEVPRAEEGQRTAARPPPTGPPAGHRVEPGLEPWPKLRGVAGGKERPRCSQREFCAPRASLLGRPRYPGRRRARPSPTDTRYRAQGHLGPRRVQERSETVAHRVRRLLSCGT
jgi:hypothetical protein